MADIPEVAALLGQLFEQEAEFRPDAAAQSEGLSLILADPALGRVLVAEGGVGIIGMATVLLTVSTALGRRVALLDDLVVDRGARGRQVGTALVRAVIEHCRAEGVARITLNSDADNLAAHRFYARFGFERSPMLPFRLKL
jgi:GNAT superfamily N-acetyltransferase